MNYKTNNLFRTRQNNQNKTTNREREELFTLLCSAKIPKSLMTAASTPLSQIVKHKMTIDNLNLQSSTLPFITLTIKINDVFSPNASLVAPGSLNGFPMYSMGYQSFQVTHTSCQYDVTNNSANFPYSFGMCFSDFLPAPTTYAQAKRLLQRPPCTVVDIVSPKNSNAQFRSPVYSMDPGAVIGNPLIYHANQEFTGTGGAVPVSPTQFVYATFVLLADETQLTIPDGVFLNWEQTFTTKWYSVTNLY